MGKLTDDKIRLTIEVNGSAAKNELGKLEKEAVSLSKSYKQLLVEKKQLNKADAEYGKKLVEINKKITENKFAIDQNKTSQEALRKSIGLSGMTMNQLNKEAMKLRAMKANLTPGTEQFNKINKELEETNRRIRELKTNSSSGGGAFGKFADTFNKYQGIALGITAAVAGAGLAIGNLVQGNAQLADSFADVQKTTGLSLKEVKELSSDFKSFNTRTPRKELLALAEEAGRLGIQGKKKIMDFVEVANQIKVSLGDDLGGNAEVAIREVGKLTEIYRVGQKYGVDFKQSMLMVGSAINEVSANSSANAGYLIELTKRMAGISSQAGISVQDIIGIAASLDTMGQSGEVASTTLNKVIVNMFKDVDSYAGIAKMSTADFYKLLKTDANEALLTVLKGLNGNNEGLSTMATKLDGLGLDGSRSVQILAALASNIELVRKQQALANESLEEGTSLTKEYQTKNNNLAGQLEVIGRKINSIFFNSKVNEFLAGIVKNVAKWIEIPVSQSLEKQRINVNMLAIELTNLNTTEERKKAIYQELQSISPKIVEGIQLESINTAKLRENLAQYNDEAIKKIAIQRAQEDLNDIQEKVGKQTEKRTEAEYALNRVLMKQVKLIKDKDEAKGIEADNTLLSSEMTALDKFNKIHEITMSMENVYGNIAIDFSTLNAAGGEYIYQLDKENELLNEANDILAKYQEKYRMIMGEKKELGAESSDNLADPVDPEETLPAGNGKTEKEKVDRDAERMKEYREEVLKSAMSLIEQERLSYQERLHQAGIFGKAEKDLTEEDLAVREQLLKQHIANIKKINDSAFSADITRMQGDFDLEMTRLETGYKEQLKLIGDNEAEKAAVTQQYEKLKEERTRQHLESLLRILQDHMPSGDDFSLDLESAVLSDEAKADLLKKIEEVKAALATLGMPEKATETPEEPEQQGPKLDIFGMSSDDWKALLINLEEGKVRLEDMLGLANAMSNAFSMINEIRSNMEERSLMEYEEQINERKEMLDTLLKYERISQERYNRRVAELDEELDAKKRKIAHDQAVRAKATAIFQAVINTATAVISALATPPPWLGIAMAALVGGMGGLQIATIASEPVPQFYAGKYDVIGQQDGKKYSASVMNSPSTGLVDSPAILVGEKPEIIIDPATTKNLMLNYPHVIESIRNARIPQFASGSLGSLGTVSLPADSQELIASVLARQTASIDRLNMNLENGIQANLLADAEYVRTHNNVSARYNRLTSKANSSW